MEVSVAEHKRVEKELRHSLEKYQALAERSLDGYARVTMDGRIIESNKAFRDMLVYTEEELCKLTYQDITPKKWHVIENNLLHEIKQVGYTPLWRKQYRRKGESSTYRTVWWAVLDSNQ